MGSFEGKVAVVTGAARGIGRVIAEKLASQGADVAICDLKAEWLADTAAAVEAFGRKALPLAVDVGDGEAVTACMAEVIKVLGKVDIMVNNAGITKDTLLVRMSDEDWDAVLRVNLKGTFLFSRAVSKHMMKQRGGAIINIASVIGLIGKRRTVQLCGFEGRCHRVDQIHGEGACLPRRACQCDRSGVHFVKDDGSSFAGGA